MASRRVRRRLQWLVRLLSRVVGFQLMYYAWFFAAGIYGVFIAHSAPPITLQGTMSHVSVQVWYWMNILGPSLGSLGIYLERTQFNYRGLWIQISGNLIFVFSLLVYITATFAIERWGTGMYGAFPLGAASLTSTTCLIIRDALRVILRRSG